MYNYGIMASFYGSLDDDCSSFARCDNVFIFAWILVILVLQYLLQYDGDHNFGGLSDI